MASSRRRVPLLVGIAAVLASFAACDSLIGLGQYSVVPADAAADSTGGGTSDALDENDSTTNWVNARRLACFKPGARFYNVGRGTTVDQNALIEVLQSGRLGSAYLDVMVPEPLPPEHPLWAAPNCYITPHSAGGRADEQDALATHFLANLAAFDSGLPMADRVA